MRRTILLLGSMALVGALSAALLLISGLGLQAVEAETATTPSSGTVTAWGDNADGQSSVPDEALSGVTAIAAGWYHSLALKNGKVLAWGNNEQGQTDVPDEALSGVTAIAAGEFHSLALKNGKVLAWGNNTYGQTNVPAAAQSGVTAISAGYYHSLALKNDGTVVAWGNSPDGISVVPAAAQSGVKAIAAGWYHSLALKDDGKVLAWGQNNFGQSNVPDEALSGVTAIAAGAYHSLALKNDVNNGKVVAWGNSGDGISVVPAAAQSGVKAISAGGIHNMALKDDGKVLAWGNNTYGQSNVPDEAQSSVTAIAAGGYHSLALTTPLANGDFETGNTSGWTASDPYPYTQVVTSYGSYQPVNGNYFALLTANQANTPVKLSQSFVAGTGTKITGNTFFQANDYLPYNDSSQVVVKLQDDAGDTLFQKSVSDVGNYGSTPWTHWEHTFTQPGDYTIVVSVTNVGDSGYSSVIGLDDVNLQNANQTADQTITFDQPQSPRSFGATFPVDPSASSGLAVTVQASGGCSVQEAAQSGYDVTMTSGTNNCVLIASQAGNGNYNAATDVTQTVVAQKANQSALNYTGPTTGTYGDKLNLSYLGGSGTGAVTYDTGSSTACELGTGADVGKLLITKGTGTCSVTVNKASDGNYNSASSGPQTINVSKAQATLTLSGLTGNTYNGSPQGVTVSTTPAGLSGVSVTYEGNAQAPTNAGSYAVVASLDNTNYEADNATGTLVIAKANQTITFTSTAPTNAVYADTYTPTATGGGSGNPVTFGASDDCSYSSVVTMTKAGTCKVTANQAGNTNYDAAQQASQQFSVAKRQANVVYTGDNYAAVAFGNATINLSAKVSRLSGSLGDLSKATVKFTVKKYDGATIQTTVYAPVNAGTGVAATTAQVPTNDNPYTVEVQVDPANAYWTSGTDVSSLQVIVLSGSARTAGGGWIADAANDINGKSNFGFTVQNSKTGIKGNSLFIYRAKEGANEVQYVVRSNSWVGGGLAFNINNDPAKATFTGKATVQRYVNGVLDTSFSSGNYTFTVDVLDGALKSPRMTDGYAIVLRNSSNQVVKQLGTRSAPVTLGGGNVLIQAK